jgi:hypothetical protein
MLASMGRFSEDESSTLQFFDFKEIILSLEYEDSFFG